MTRPVVLWLLLVACAPAQPAAPARNPAAETGPRVVFPDGFEVSVEIAADPELRAQGLMYRDQLRPGSGMLFLFPADGLHSFWMKNTRISLDMVWLDSNRRIVHVESKVPPCQVEDCPSYGPRTPSRHVLEVAAGVAGEHALKPGDVLLFKGTDGLIVR